LEEGEAIWLPQVILLRSLMIQSIDPRTNEVIKTFDPLNYKDLLSKIKKANDAFNEIKGVHVSVRAACLEKIANAFEKNIEGLARLAVSEMGKPIGQARAEILKCARVCKYYAQNGPKFLESRPYDANTLGASRAFVRYEPLGVILGIMPWNFPYWQVIRFAVPALLAGNTILLKHAPNVPQVALALEEVIDKNWITENSFTNLFIETDQVKDVIENDYVKGVSLTGSSRAGKSVAQLAGTYLKPSVLELGGSDPFIVCQSADIKKAVEIGVKSRVQNNGQSCIAAKRFLVIKEVYDEFRAELIKSFESLRVGDPFEEATDIGPLVSNEAITRALEFIEDARNKGASITLGGYKMPGPGNYLKPTIIEAVTKDMDIYYNEVFAPVVQLYKVNTLYEAVELANDTNFGLGANCFTNDKREQDFVIEHLESCAVFINSMTVSYPELPFGGIKQSGYGRELSELGLYSFSNIKTVYIA
jgi:succinate-semialdehyde dehydrogenase/glutarate-semialdehyde dehydrogenase